MKDLGNTGLVFIIIIASKIRFAGSLRKKYAGQRLNYQTQPFAKTDFNKAARVPILISDD